MQDKHDNCLSETCLCRNNNHNEKVWTFKDGVRLNSEKPVDSDFIKEWNEINNPRIGRSKFQQNTYRHREQRGT